MTEKMLHTKKTTEEFNLKPSPKISGSKKRWGELIVEVILLLIWVGSSVIASQYVVGYLIIWTMGSGAFDNPVVTAIFSAISYLLAMVLIILVPPKIKRLRSKKKKEEKKLVNREELGLKGLPIWTDIGLAPVGFIAYYILAVGLEFLFKYFPWFNVTEAQNTGFSPYIVGNERLIAFFTLVIIAPIAEEIIFRGWLYQKLKTRFSKETSYAISAVISAFLVSVLFGCVHGQWNVGVNVFAMSLVLCGLREITGTIYAGILLHMLKNGVAFYFLYVVGTGW